MLTNGNQLRAARSLIGWEQTDVAASCGLSVTTIRNMEASGKYPIAGRSLNVQKVQRALEEAGIEFLNHGLPGVRTTRVHWRSTREGHLPPVGVEVLVNYQIGKMLTHRATFDRSNRLWTLHRDGTVLKEEDAPQWAPAPWNYSSTDWPEKS